MTDPFTAAVVCAYLFGEPDPLCFELLKYSDKEFIEEYRLGQLFSLVDLDDYPDIPVSESPDLRVLRSTYTLGRKADYF